MSILIGFRRSSLRQGHQLKDAENPNSSLVAVRALRGFRANLSIHSQLACLSRGQRQTVTEDAGLDLVPSATVFLQRSTPPEEGRCCVHLPPYRREPPTSTETEAHKCENLWWTIRASGALISLLPFLPQAHYPGHKGTQPSFLELSFNIIFRLWLSMTKWLSHPIEVWDEANTNILPFLPQNRPLQGGFWVPKHHRVVGSLFFAGRILNHMIQRPYRFCQIAEKAEEILDKSAASENQFPNAM